MKRVAVVSGCIAAVFMALFLVFFAYIWKDYKIFSFLSSQPTLDNVAEVLGETFSGFEKNDLKQLGWELPKSIPSESEEILIFDSITGRRYYLFVGRDRRRVIGFFSSSS